jgi:DNA-cytosine methyltransferase
MIKMGIKVLSLFDGISCGQVALERAGIEVDKYFASEINESAIKITQNNYPKTIQLGNVESMNLKELPKIDLLIGGSPCQSLSSSNVWLKDGEYGVNGEGKSRLFWEYVKALLTIKPTYFFFENVASMRNIDRGIITEQLGVKPVMINSFQFSGQRRRRYYWTNIPFEIKDKRYVNTTMQDILESKVEDKYYLKQGTLDCIMRPASKGWKSGKMEIDLQIARPITASCWKIHRADTDNYITTEYKPEDRTNVRRLIPLECERLQTLPDNYTEGISDKDRYEAVGNGWTVDVIAYIFSFIKPRQNVSNCLKFKQ